MHSKISFLPSSLVAVLFGGCVVPGADDEDTGASAPTTSADDDGGSSSSVPATGGASGSDDASTSDNTDASETGSIDDTGNSPAQWTMHTHSCSGASRTDALLVEADGTMWVGCGTNAVGYGLHTSSDGGQTWTMVETDPEGEMAEFRVSAIARGEDGLLYAAGFDANDSDMILALDTSTSPMAVQEVLVAGGVVGTSFHVGSMALLSGGRIVAESLTGLGTLYREDDSVGSDGATWFDAYYWANAGSPPGYQMQDLVVLDDQLYGCGATIAEPPYVFLPPTDAAAEPWALQVRELPNTGWTGEMWGVAATADRVAVVGVDQDGDVGKIYISGEDIYDAAGYAETNLTDIVGDSNLGTWARGVCMQGETIVVVGERQPLGSGTGLVLLSQDAGASFTNITPDDVTESVSKCTITDDGAIIVAGAGGLVGIYG